MQVAEHVLAIIGGFGVIAIFALIIAAAFLQDEEKDGCNPFE